MAWTEQDEAELSALKAEVEKVANPKRVTTREQALANAEAVDGPTEGGPWYMDVAGEMLNPVDAVAGMATGGLKAAGHGVRALGNLLRKPVAAMGERQAAINMIKNPATLEPYARGLIDDAAGKMSSRIGSKDDALRALLQGKTGKINPDTVSEVMPQFGEKLAARRTGITKGSMGEDVASRLPSGDVEVSGDQLLRMKRVGDKQKNYSFSDSLNPQTVAKAKDASRMSDVARSQIYDIAPGSEEVLESMGKDIRLKNFLQKRGGSNPVSTIMTQPGTLKDSIVAQADEAAGTGLRAAGSRLQSAKKDIIEPKNFLRPLQLPGEVAKVGKRAAIAGGSAVNKTLGAVASTPGMVRSADALGYATAKNSLAPSEEAPEQSSDWTDQDEQELEMLKKSVMELTGR